MKHKLIALIIILCTFAAILFATTTILHSQSNSTTQDQVLINKSSNNTTINPHATFSQATVDITILGPKGFDRSGFTAKTNEVITFQNKNTKEYPAKQEVVIMIQNKDDQFEFINSPKIQYGDTWTISFDTKAEYTLWAVGHDIQIPLTIIN